MHLLIFIDLSFKIMYKTIIVFIFHRDLLSTLEYFEKFNCIKTRELNLKVINIFILNLTKMFFLILLNHCHNLFLSFL